MRDTLTAVLRKEYRVLRAATGEAALQIIDKEDVDLMLLDVRLPGINGFEVLKITKENYPYIEVIVISVLKELETAIEAMRNGAYHYMSKDFDFEGYTIPQGSYVFVAVVVPHFDTRYFTNPREFEPDRFAQPRSEGARPYVYAPFGLGLHVCPSAGLIAHRPHGRRSRTPFALATGGIALVALLGVGTWLAARPR